MNYFVRFWLVVGSLLVGLAAVAVLLLSFVFPGAVPLAVGTTERLALTFVAAVAVGILVLSVLAGESGVGGSERPE